ncbi:MAG: hypothetical protein A2788_00140 [Candidatus Abawacabacteria bacterium RIFCSPHIGHO2_01_FULL_46_8]|uniref:Peptidase C39-like domain-containing protein n=1 Tax=Candidatus Abawacabacteria bacterium RIFCSPHIGHO2_01_FULL_46_8 TaxID=1817815 RepID=A0A1F4XLL1_9BACT|nr:MAG: hypothetical protein A2788_00140 [Candidatus Abawacabacteria bacterium RIFCSPHIGHO2_01_FULL_46_8]
MLRSLAIPFYECQASERSYQACLLMALKFVTPAESRSLSELDELCLYQAGQYPWLPLALLALSKEDWETKYVSNFPWEKYLADPAAQLKALYGKSASELAQAYPSKENLAKWLPQVKEQEALIEERLLEPDELIKLHQAGWCLIAVINIKALKGEKGVEPRCVMITGIDANSISFHDPGPEGRSNHKVGLDLFLKAWRYPADQGELVALRQAIVPIMAELE